MTKKELLELLKDVPDDGLIVLSGDFDGGGFADCGTIKAERVIHAPDDNYYWSYIRPFHNSEPTDVFQVYEIS